MHRLGIPQERITERLGQIRETIRNHLADLSKGFTVSQVAEKHGWTEPMVWSLALEGEEEIERFKEIGWGLRTWDNWEWNDCDRRFGDDWPGRIPAQLVAHILYYFSKQKDLILDPMAGGGVTPDVCLALNRRSFPFMSVYLDPDKNLNMSILPYKTLLNNFKYRITSNRNYCFGDECVH